MLKIVCELDFSYNHMLQNADHGHQQDLPYKIKIKIKSEAEKVEAEEAKGGEDHRGGPILQALLCIPPFNTASLNRGDEF